MFYSLTGTVVYQDASSVAIECAGVAFRLNCSVNTVRSCGQTGSQAKLYTYMSVREDAIELFGFASTEELDFFKLLIGVSGVGPKGALAILSALEPPALAVAVAAGDIKAITSAPGIGSKTAQRIVMELKDKMSKVAPDHISVSSVSAVAAAGISGNKAEAISALVSLGYPQNAASDALSGLDASQPVESLIRQGLKLLSGRF